MIAASSRLEAEAIDLYRRGGRLPPIGRLLAAVRRFRPQLVLAEYSGVRHLPLNFRPHDDGEIVFLRLMRMHDDGRVSFFPSSLSFDPERDPPVEVVSSRRVELRGWRQPELLDALAAAGFEHVESLGSFERASYDPDESADLILVAR